MKTSRMTTVATLLTLVAVAMAFTLATPVRGECSSDLSPYKVCMPAVLGDFPLLPSPDCCKVIKGADIPCFCTTVTHANVPALNVGAALMLPKRCGAISPGTSTCGTAGNPLARKLLLLR